MESRSLKKGSLIISLGGIFIVLAILIGAGHLIIKTIHTYYYDELAADSDRLARSYAQNLQTAAQASDIINELLEEKLIGAGRAALQLGPNPPRNQIAQVAKAFAVDEIYLYAPEGVVTDSSTGIYVGWRPDSPSHPVARFRDSDDNRYVEGIRPDSESGVLYKYAYVRADDGRFVQVGVFAEKVYDFLGTFEVTSLLKDMHDENFVGHICYLDPSFSIVATVGDEYTQDAINDILTDNVKSMLQSGTVYSVTTKHNNRQIYQKLIPIMADGKRIGTLVLGHDLSQTETLMTAVSIIGVGAMVLIAALLGLTFLVVYRKNKQLTHEAYYSSLTDLPNKHHLEEYLDDLLDDDSDKDYALIVTNYRNFRIIHTTYGFHYAEDVIKQIGNLLRSTESEDTHLFHMGGDRFAVIVESVSDRDVLDTLCERIVALMRQSVPTSTVGGHIGIVEFNGKADESADSLLRNASIAAESIDSGELYGYKYYDDIKEARVIREGNIEAAIKHTLIPDSQEGSLHLVYQPVIDLNTGKTRGFEALARIESAELGPLAPSEFIPVAERTQLIVPFGELVMRKACHFARRLEDTGYSNLEVTFNVSAIQLMRDDFVKTLASTIADIGVRAEMLGIEITESIFADNFLVINKRLETILNMGLSVSIDDFGTGYSSLARERELKVSILKIDKYFIDKLLKVTAEEAITGDIISMAHRLGHKVVAEGVEYDIQRQYLVQYGCDYAQGYLFSKPLSEALALKYLLDGTTKD